MKCDVFSGFCLLDPDIFSADAIRADEDVDMFTDFGEVEGFGDGSISCSDDRYREIFVEIPITGRTVRYSLSIELHFARSIEFFVFISGGEDDSFCLVGISFLSFQDELIFANLRHFFDTVLDDGRSCRFGMFLEVLHDFSSWS